MQYEYKKQLKQIKYKLFIFYISFLTLKIYFTVHVCIEIITCFIAKPVWWLRYWWKGHTVLCTTIHREDAVSACLLLNRSLLDRYIEIVIQCLRRDVTESSRAVSSLTRQTCHGSALSADHLCSSGATVCCCF